ncbi:hypothetical protein VKT23_010101 [Stygiomarasmius scandens]|uniref:DUF7330 domain-containing protein n=1 Tax=Marasmiellus scandens TaxID=2682957 RepID=A0ABR1JGS2_9AGAR
MIAPHEKANIPADSQESKVATTSTTVHDDPPPEYANALSVVPKDAQIQPHTLSGTVPPGPTTVATSSQAVNYISLNQPLGSIDCKYIIDPFVYIPRAFLPPLAEGQSEVSRKNLSLRTKMGGITADVTMWHDDSAERKEKMEKGGKMVNMEMKALVGTIWLKLRDPTPRPTSQRPPFFLRCFTRTGTLFVELPRSFHGFILVTTTVGAVTLSTSLQSTARWLDSGLRSRRCFIGDMSGLSDHENGNTWTGDEVKLEASFGAVQISYVDEGKWHL